jgi:hypothetical protein
MQATVDTLPLAEVQHLHIEIGLPRIDWSGLLQHSPEIHTIHLEKSYPKELFDVLTDCGEEMEKSAGPVSLIVPQLRSLQLTHVDFDAVGCDFQSFFGMSSFSCSRWLRHPSPPSAGMLVSL